MDTIEVVGLLPPLTWLLMYVVEKIRPARHYPPRRGWGWIGAGFLVLLGVVGTVVPLLVDPEWLATHRLIDGSGLGVVGGTVVGYTVLSGVMYAYHRAMHAHPLAWRLTHQIHHSPQRLDMPGATVFHPVEMVIQVLMLLAVTIVVLGLDPLAAALTGYVASFYGLFQHWNIRTPRWIGYFIQRPEAHGEHHRRGQHAYNYGDLPIWDILLGTFRNPATFDGEVGFDAPADRQMARMLAFSDVNEPVYGSGSRGAARGRALQG